jgi:hypothetical protein
MSTESPVRHEPGADAPRASSFPMAVVTLIVAALFVIILVAQITR